MDTENIKKKFKHSIRYVKRRNPFKIQRTESGIELTKEDTSFNPKKDGHDSRVFLTIVDGMDSTVKEVTKHGDDMVLEYEDKYCAITSKPLLIEGNQIYLTKNGFIGTMALNRDTLLGGDVFQQSTDAVERKISKDVNLELIPHDIEEISHKEDNEYFYVKNSEIGDVASLHGSKKTLKDVNKAKRLRKLLQPSSMDRKKLLMAIGSGVAIGFYLYPRVN